MKKPIVVMKKDLRETLRNKAFYGTIVGTLFLVFTLLSQGIAGLMRSVVSETDISAAQSLLGTTAFMVSLLTMTLYCMYINTYTVATEKVKRTLEALFCTPLSLRQIWLGKSLAVFLPSLIFGWLFTFGSIAALNYLLIAPGLGQVIMPGPAPLVAAVVAVPLIALFLSLLVIALQLIISNPGWVNAVLLFLIFGVGFGLSPVLRFSPSSWNIVFVSLGIAGVLALCAFLLSSRLSKERIVLSSKG